MSIFRKLVLASSVAAVGLGVATAAEAQQNQANTSTATSSSEDEIVVTGSRLKRPPSTFTSAVPLAVVSEAQIAESGSAQLGDVVAELPQINPNNNLQNTSGTLFNTGQNRADLRGLGSNRTLVLVDGRRHIFTDARSPGVDLNMIPSMMVSRIEAISGGASAVYGSEAISGVVNVVLNKSLEGFKFDVQVGEAMPYGDGEEQRYSGAYGGKFGNGRGHYILGAEYSRVENILQKDRPELYPGVRRNNLVTPQTILPASRSITGSDVTSTSFVLSSTRTAVLSRDYSTVTRLTDPQCFTAAPTALCQDPALGYSQVYNEIQGQSERGTARAYIDYDFTPEWKGYVELGYGEVDGYGIFQPAFSNTGTMVLSFKGDNAFLNSSTPAAAALRAEWLAAGKTLTSAATAQAIRFYPEFGGRDSNTHRELYRGVAGVDGTFSVFGKKWSANAYYQWGQVKSDLFSLNVPNTLRVQQAVDSIVVGGNVVCRSGAAGCVPFDLVNGPSKAAIAWTNASSSSLGITTEHVVNGALSGDLFNLPAGAVTAVVGAEYRKEQNKFDQDALSTTGALFINAIGDTRGKFDVTEYFGELRIPILKDQPFAKDLSFEAAYRNSDYSTSGSADATRYVLSYEPVEGLRFRGSTGTSVRAPNIIELYAPQSQNFATVRDPCDRTSTTPIIGTAANVLANCAAAIPGYDRNTFVSNIRTQTARLLQGGNPNLTPEEADTDTIGVVFQPSFVPRLQASFDWYRINLTNGIGTLGAQNTIDLCYSAQPTLGPTCANVKRDTSALPGNSTGVVGGVTDIIVTNLNLSSTDVEGWDASASYNFDVADMLRQSGDWGNLSLRLDLTRQYKFHTITAPGLPLLHLENTVSNATPEWKGFGTVSWTQGKFNLGWSTTYIGRVGVSNTLNGNTVTQFETHEYYLHNLRAKYDVNERLSLRAGVLNLTNKFPQQLPETATGTGTGSSLYDNRGRFMYVGASYNF